jgi:hypothetical protein
LVGQPFEIAWQSTEHQEAGEVEMVFRRKQQTPPPAPQQQSSLFDPTKIDVISKKKNGDARLFIVQDQPWTGSDAEIESLELKVRYYVSFATGGALVALEPQFSGRPWAIVLDAYTGRPDVRTLEVLNRLGEVVGQHGGALVLHEMLPPVPPERVPTTVNVTRLDMALRTEPFEL